MKNTHTIKITLNTNGLSYTVVCFPLGIHHTVHHHDLDWFLNKSKKDANKNGLDVKFSDYVSVFDTI